MSLMQASTLVDLFAGGGVIIGYWHGTPTIKQPSGLLIREWHSTRFYNAMCDYRKATASFGGVKYCVQCGA